MTLSDKIIQLLYIEATTMNGLCEQLGMKWTDIRETVGMMRAHGFISSYIKNANHDGMSSASFFYLTLEGMGEFKKRGGREKKR